MVNIGDYVAPEFQLVATIVLALAFFVLVLTLSEVFGLQKGGRKAPKEALGVVQTPSGKRSTRRRRQTQKFEPQS